MAGFQAGEPAALSEVFRRYAPAVWSVAVGILHDRALADDAVQETFVRAWRASVRFDPTRPLGPWLFAIARRAAIDVHRREMRPTRGDHAAETDQVVVDDPTDEAWLRWEVRQALDRLPERDRRLMRLLHLEGHTHAQAAELLDLPVGTVKSRSHRAHRRLAEILAHLQPLQPAASAVASQPVPARVG